MEALSVMGYYVHFQSHGGLALFSLKVDYLAGIKLRTLPDVVETQDFREEQVVVLGYGFVCFPLLGIYKRNIVKGIHNATQGEAELFRRGCGRRRTHGHRLFQLGGRLRHVCKLFVGEEVKTGQVILLYAADKLVGIGRVRGITSLLEAESPALVVPAVQVEKEFVAVPVAEEVAMVTEALLRGIVRAEALSLAVIVHIHGTALPVVMALDTKVVVAVHRKGGQAGTGLYNTLGKGDAGRNAGALHLRHRNI